MDAGLAKVDGMPTIWDLGRHVVFHIIGNCFSRRAWADSARTLDNRGSHRRLFLDVLRPRIDGY